MEDGKVSEEKPAPTRDERGWFAPGNKLGGRPKGSRNRLGEAFLSALADDFDTNGPEVIARVREERPADYLKVCASILPKEFNIKADPLEEMSDGELDRYIRKLAAVLSIEAGTSESVGTETVPTTH